MQELFARRSDKILTAGNIFLIADLIVQRQFQILIIVFVIIVGLLILAASDVIDFDIDIDFGQDADGESVPKHKIRLLSILLIVFGGFYALQGIFAHDFLNFLAGCCYIWAFKEQREGN